MPVLFKIEQVRELCVDWKVGQEGRESGDKIWDCKSVIYLVKFPKSRSEYYFTIQLKKGKLPKNICGVAYGSRW